MANIFLFLPAFTHTEKIASQISSIAGYRIVTDPELIDVVSKKYKVNRKKIEKAIFGKTSVFNEFTHERELAVACLKAVLAVFLLKDKILYLGFAGHLIPKEISHVIRVLAISERSYRIQQAVMNEKLSEKDAEKLLHTKDESAFLWTEYLFKKDPWDYSLYDIVIPFEKHGIDAARRLVMENLKTDVVQPTENTKKAIRDFAMAAQVEVALVSEGHDICVNAKDGSVTLTINKNVLMLKSLEQELKGIAEKIPGVRSVETMVGKDFYQTDIYRKHNFEVPSKVLFVDDERDFVLTLSERLLLRGIGSAVTYDGESALKLVDEDEPEVMILDLNMPGIDGIEVLQKIKETRPEIEVIILTGHGSENDRETCMKLGAFAFLQKPLNIDLLNKTLNEAYKKSRMKNASAEQEG